MRFTLFFACDVRRTITGCGIFFCADFLDFIALNSIWPHFLGTKLRFYPILYPLNTLSKSKLMLNGKEKSKFSDVRVKEYVEALLLSLKAKRNRKIYFFGVRSKFHSWTPKLVFSLPPLVSILRLVFIRWNKIWSYTEKFKYPLYILSEKCSLSVSSYCMPQIIKYVPWSDFLLLLYVLQIKHRFWLTLLALVAVMINITWLNEWTENSENAEPIR